MRSSFRGRLENGFPINPRMNDVNTIHPTAVIGSSVRMGTGNVVGPYAVIGGFTHLGNDNWFGSHVVIGAPPEIRDFTHPVDWIDGPARYGVSIGHGNVIREGVNIHSGSQRHTMIGDETFVMNQAYIAHDDVVGDRVTLAAHVSLAGHVAVGAGANIGLGAAVHQRCSVGAYAMVGMSSVVTRSIPPFALAVGSPARVRRVNSVGMERAGFGVTEIEWATAWIEAGAPVGAPHRDIPEDLVAIVKQFDSMASD